MNICVIPVPADWLARHPQPREASLGKSDGL